MFSGGKGGQSTFFTTNRRSADAEDLETTDRKKRASVRGSSTLPPNLALNSPDPLHAYKEQEHKEEMENFSRPGSATSNNPVSDFLFFPNNYLFNSTTLLRTVSTSPTVPIPIRQFRRSTKLEM